MIGVFVDTFVILTLNALVIISTLYTSGDILTNGYTGAVIEILNKTNLVQSAFSSVLIHLLEQCLLQYVLYSLLFQQY